jgi:hypothetical protein
MLEDGSNWRKETLPELFVGNAIVVAMATV